MKVASVSGVDAAHLVLANVDLTGCRFIGAVHLDQLRMDGHCTLAQPLLACGAGVCSRCGTPAAR